MYEEFTKNDFRTFKEWLSFIKAIGNAIPETSYLQWCACTHKLIIDIPTCELATIEETENIIGKYF